MKNILKPLTIDIPMPLGLTAAASETNAAIQNKFLDLVCVFRT